MMPTIEISGEYTMAIRCDGCGRFAGPNFDNRHEAELWLRDRDQDFKDGGELDFYYTIRAGDVFARVAGKLHCGRCVERLIERSKILPEEQP